MYIEPTAIGHPTQRQLVQFAESLVDRHAAVSALLATHVSNCPACAREVKRIRASFELAALARSPEPSRELTQRIIKRARQERVRRTQQPDASPSRWPRWFQIAVCLLAVTALAYVSFSTALSNATDDGPPPSLNAAVPESPFTVNGLKQQTENVQALASAVSLPHELSSSPAAARHRRALESLNEDMSAALAALERNPGSPRANQVMETSVARQLEGLRNLYLDRTL